jgi:hypothetical protein
MSAFSKPELLARWISLLLGIKHQTTLGFVSRKCGHGHIKEFMRKLFAVIFPSL